MKTATKFLLVFVAVVSLSLAARATAIFTISDGIDPAISVSDNGPGDQSPATGAIVVQTNIGVWFLVIDIGETKPLFGGATSPAMDINVEAESIAGGTLTMEFSDNNFGPANGTVNTITTGSTISGALGSATTSIYGDQGNNTLALSDLIASSSGTLPFGSTLIATSSGPLTLNVPYSMTEVLQVSSSGATFVNVDGSFTTAVPEPGIPALGALAIAGWALFRSRRPA